LAALTKGYGGADLRSLCTEAALNAVQGTFPQIYSSNKKLLIDPSQIRVQAKDFMISVNKIVPSSERSASSGASALKPNVEPLLRDALAKVSAIIDDIIPQKKPITALEEAMYDDRNDEHGFEKENLQREFESSRINRPRLLISGLEGMGQQYISAALLAKFEGLHVQSFDMSTLLKDSTRSPEAAVVQLFEEVKRHKPSVIYLPSIDIWYETMGQQVIKTFNGLLRTLAPTDPVLVLGVMELRSSDASPNQEMMRELFSRSRKNYFVLERPGETARREFFSKAMNYIRKSPAEFPQPENRKKRILPALPEAPILEEQPKAPSKAELKAQKKKDRFTLNNL
ncbi:AAA-domain-containing protein, partial [Aureobasidium melanogenum]